MKQEDLAIAISRTASWVSQVERGVQPVVRLDVLQLLADGLGVSTQTLRPDAPAAQLPAPPPEEQEQNDLDEARLLISGHPALDALLAESAPQERPDLEELQTAVDEVWALTHAARFAELSALLNRVLPRLERACRTATPELRPEFQTLLSTTYQALAASFVRQDEADAAWVAADRSIRAAEQSGQAMQVFAGIYRLAQAFVRLKHLDQAEHAAATAVSALRPYVDREGTTPEALSLLGALHLVLALVHARAGQRVEARQEIENARRVAARIGEDRNDFNLEFGPTNVEIQAVSTAVDLGDAGEALDIGERIDASALSNERRSRLLMDLGRAHAQRRHIGEALDSLLRAEELAPETVRTHTAARASIRELVLLAGRSAPQELLSLAQRAGVAD
jgi:transcriptional regulator with XRE-family HTH domain